MSSCSLRSLSMLVTTMIGTRRFCKLSLDVCTLFTIGVLSVMLPCPLQSLSTIVTKLSVTQGLCKLSLDLCTHCSVSGSDPSGQLDAIVTFYAGEHLEWNAPSVHAVVRRVHTFSIGVIFVISPCSLQTLSMLVTTLSGTRRLYKLSLDVCTLLNICVSFVITPCSLQKIFW
jgi:hypothetical protein